MSGEPIRLRRHTDGRVALSLWPHRWKIVVWRYSTTAIGWLPDDEVTSPDWSELLVSELPKPNGSLDVTGSNGEDAKTPYWTGVNGSRVTAWINGVETEGDGLIEDLAGLRANALKVLAAVAACERLRQEVRDDGR